MHSRTVRVFALVVTLSLTLLACDVGGFVGSTKPTVIIVSPPSGSQFHDGDDVTIQTTSTDSSGVARVELLVDGAVVRTDSAPSPQVSFPLVQTWKAKNGTHTLSVRAYNAANSASDPAAVSVTVSAAEPTTAPTLVVSIPTLAPTAVPATKAPTAAPSGATATPGACTNNAVFVADVTVPDGTPIAAGQAFNKIWRLRNTGTCPWGVGYQFLFVAGEAMTPVTTYGVPATDPSATADLLVAMTAPAAAGTHFGQWRLRSPQGDAFGVTVNVTIVVPTSGGTPPTATPTTSATGCSGTPNIASFTASPSTVTAGSAVNLAWGAVTNAESVDIDQGIGGVATPGNVTVTPGATTVYTLAAHCGTNTATRQVTVTVNPLVVVPSTPAMVAPADGMVFRVFPRVATFSWGTVSFPGGVTYNIEIQINTGSWTGHVTQTGLGGTTYTMPDFSGDNQGRWRVWATSASAGAGPKSAWRTFSFNTGASQYSGTWINNDAATSGVTRIIISNSGQTLSVHPYGKCSPTDCDWGAKSQLYVGEPFVITGFPAGLSHQLSITLDNAAGTTLKVVDSGGGGGTFTYTFHK